MKKLGLYMFILILITSLSSCSLFSPVKSPIITEYLINTTPKPVHKANKEKITLLVSLPEAKGPNNSTKMYYTLHPHQLDSFSVNAWAQSPAQMLYPLIVQTLDQTKHFHAIVTPPFSGDYHYYISTQLIEFQQDFTRRPAIFKLKLRAQIINMKTREVVSARVFSIYEPIRFTSPESGVRSANIAVRKMLNQLAQFVVNAI
jgi:cholesterol transport system auxiliary component